MTAKTKDIQLAREFAEKLKYRLGNNLLSITLFGSRARGDAKDGSDFDFIITVRSVLPQTRSTVTDVSVEMMNKYNELFSGIIYDEAQWRRVQKFPLGWNVTKEGIAL